MNQEKLRGIAGRLRAFTERYAEHFDTKTRSNSTTANHYVNGLIQTPKKNMERMEEVVPETNEQALQHFITNSPWNEKPLVAQIAHDADKSLGDLGEAALLIDESSFAKKGKSSVGVARQWCGRLGKIDNCQVAVFAALALKDKSVPIDYRLYLPEEWTSDIPRCLKAGVPKEEIQFKTKPELAIELIKAAIQRKTRFGWVAADAFYGKDPKFIASLFELNLTFVIDVHKNQTLYSEDGKGISVEQWTLTQPEVAWKSITIRDSTKGPIKAQIIHRKAWIKTGTDHQLKEVRVIVQKRADEIKYAISNAPDSITDERLAFMQGQRFWIERAFEDAKSSLGMGHYQIRKWRAWNHHMALVLLAQLFLAEERIANAKDIPLLSCQDIVTLLAFYLPKRNVTEEEIFRQLEKRHKQRKRRDRT